MNTYKRYRFQLGPPRYHQLSIRLDLEASFSVPKQLTFFDTLRQVMVNAQYDT
jgi:hypothetical protein